MRARLDPIILLALSWSCFVFACASSAAPVRAGPTGRGGVQERGGDDADPGGSTERGVASFYHRSLAGNSTASGEKYQPDELTCAHRTLAFGTRVKVTLVRTGASAVCRVNDRGPFAQGRILDLSEGMAAALGVAGDDIHQVELTVAP